MSDTPQNEPCPICGHEAMEVRERREIQVGARRVMVDDTRLRCPHCEEEFYRPGALEDLQRQAAARVRAEEGLLTPDEIRAIRQGLGLTQAAFEKLLGVGPKTVVRWERGTVFQSRAIDSLLRVVGQIPEASALLARRNQVILARTTMAAATSATPFLLDFAKLHHFAYVDAAPVLDQGSTGQQIHISGRQVRATYVPLPEPVTLDVSIFDNLQGLRGDLAESVFAATTGKAAA